MWKGEHIGAETVAENREIMGLGGGGQFDSHFATSNGRLEKLPLIKHNEKQWLAGRKTVRRFARWTV
jgi:hypothetical protein